jgi:RNA polymerase sigma-70 factor (ECF subfamily)
MMPVHAMEREGIGPEQLARQCRDGSVDAFEEIVRHFSDRIYNFHFQMVGNHADAQDLAQETFLNAYRGIHRFDPGFPFAPWLFAIARHTAANHYRRAKTYDPLPEEAESSEPHPGQQAEQADASRSLWALAKRLKPRFYEALWLHYGEGFSTEEVARVMRTNVIHVKVLLHRARSQLGKLLEHQPSDG